ncbi:MAG: hypothetical protein ACTSQN_18210 [Candidatus Heimdallarchaeota archaeon]
MRYKLLTNALLVLGISLLFILPILLNVKSSTNYTKKIELVNQVEFTTDFDSHQFSIDEEHNRLFLSHNGLKIYNIADPKNIQLIKSIPEIFSKGIIKYHNGYLFTVNLTTSGQYIKVYTITPENDIEFVNETEPFDYTSDMDNAVNHVFFPKDGLMITCGGRFRCWDISDLNNITSLSSYNFYELIIGHWIGEAIIYAGIALHPDEDVFLLAGNYAEHANGEVHLFDYSDPTNITKIDFPLETFEQNSSTLRIATKNSLVSNGYYPYFSTGAQTLEVINWQNAYNPIFGHKSLLPSRDNVDVYPKFVNYEHNTTLVFDILSGIVNFSDFNDVHYLSECNTDKSLQTYYNPLIFNDYIYCMNPYFVHGVGVRYYLYIYEISNTSPNGGVAPNNLQYLAFLALIPIIIIPILLFKKKSN